MASYSLKISSHYRFVLLKTDKHGTHYTTHQIVNHGGRWIADGRVLIPSIRSKSQNRKLTIPLWHHELVDMIR